MSKIKPGDVCIVNLPVKVKFEWSDKIVVDFASDENHTEYREGWVMKVLPQKIVYNEQPIKDLKNAKKNKEDN